MAIGAKKAAGVMHGSAFADGVREFQSPRPRAKLCTRRQDKGSMRTEPTAPAQELGVSALRTTSGAAAITFR